MYGRHGIELAKSYKYDKFDPQLEVLSGIKKPSDEYCHTLGIY